MPDMFLCSVSKVMYGKICALPLGFVINEPANQFDFQFENVFLLFFLNILWSKLIKQNKVSNLHYR